MQQTKYVYLFANGTTFQTRFKESAANHFAKMYEAKKGRIICKFIIKYK